jgi:CDP-diacylglycerol---serine O-phosphatidyltransferase
MPELRSLRSQIQAPGKQSRIRGRLAAYRARRAEGRPRRQIPRAAVPSFFTLMHLFSGFLAIIQTMEGRFDWACWLIVLAAFFDVLDGMMARLTNSSSIFGVELDSLADVVSFGVAPAILVYSFGLRELGALGLIVSSLPAICGAVRLARFNVSFEGVKKDYFVGLPIPGMALFIVALILNFNSAEWFARISPSNLTILMPIVVFLSLLMISTIKFDAIPRPSAAYVRANPRKSLLYGLGLLLVVILHQIGLLIVYTVYLLVNLGMAVRTVVMAVVEEPVEGDGQKEDGTRHG